MNLITLILFFVFGPLNSHLKSICSTLPPRIWTGRSEV